MKTQTIHIFGLLLLAFFLFPFQHIQAQEQAPQKYYNKQDTLRGSIGKGRMGWDVLHYDIAVEPHIVSKTITGSCTIRFRDSGISLMQLDLQEPMQIDSIVESGTQLAYTREGNVYWVVHPIKNNSYPMIRAITCYYQGKPIVAKRPPWDGGWIWQKDSLQNPWISVACEGIGASIWFPCKDHLYDKPDSGSLLRITVPDSLMAIGNGKLVNTQIISGNRIQYSWAVKNPISLYNIIPYIGNYQREQYNYDGINGQLSLSYWPLTYHRTQAHQQFKQVPVMLKAFEHWFGAYPFYNDGYQLIEAPFLGMEHQSAIAYGNKFKNGYLGTDRSNTGWGLKWDFIIIHESGHEWFGNHISCSDMADLWIHEGFTTYAEVLFTEYYYGQKAARDYLAGLRYKILNDIPIIAPYGVNETGSGDMYIKAANMIHYMRQVIGDDKKFRSYLKWMVQEFGGKTIHTREMENYWIACSGKNFAPLFNQYLRTTKIPVLNYYVKNNSFYYRWSNVVDGFTLPLKVNLNGKEKWLSPEPDWKKLSINPTAKKNQIKIVSDFYVELKEEKTQ